MEFVGWHGRPPGAHYRAADADSERVINVLKTAFTEGRLTKEEYDIRVERALSARTYADLGALTDDLPVPRAPVVPRHGTFELPRQPARPAPAQTNTLARTALILGLAQIVSFPLGIAAAIVGTKARRQIRRTGEAGYGMATAGMVLGWIGITVLIVVVLVVGLRSG